ncbi:MAG TPA: RDD family protein [Elusimicrobiota bacterium]|nr:RDD family protein [Elusimicrobiota bacterium]
MSHQPTPRQASFSERTVAFAADAAPFLAGWVLTLKALDAGAPVTAHPKGAAAALLWGGLFLASQAYFSSEGRVTPGKRLLGLRVVGHDGEAPSLAHGIGRSLGYLVSQFFAAGFLWSLLDPNGRALHDLPFATLVVADRPARAGRSFATRFAAAALIAGFAGFYGWENVWAPRYERLMTVAYAKDGLREYAVLQRTYKLQHGRYADSKLALAAVSMDPRGFLQDSAALYDQGAVGITADKDHFSIAARANDVDKTLVAISGP